MTIEQTNDEIHLTLPPGSHIETADGESVASADDDDDESGGEFVVKTP